MGVVFVNITEDKGLEEALRENEEILTRELEDAQLIHHLSTQVITARLEGL